MIKIRLGLYNLFSMNAHVIGLYRVMHFLHTRVPRSGFLVQAIRHFMRIYSSCDISPKAVIGMNFKMPHPLCVVIGDGVVVGDDVKIWQQVTLGSHGKKGHEMSYPVIENGARIYVGSTIIGGVTVGENALIGAHSLVLADVPAGKTAVGSPAKVLGAS